MFSWFFKNCYYCVLGGKCKIFFAGNFFFSRPNNDSPSEIVVSENDVTDVSNDIQTTYSHM